MAEYILFVDAILNVFFGEGVLHLFLFLYLVPFTHQLKTIEKNITI